MLSLSISAANATTWYVSTNGNDANPGTADAPFATLTTPCRKAAPGDTIYLRGGTYYLAGTQGVMCSGTSSSPINISSYPNERAVLDGSHTSSTGDGVWITGSYVNLSNIDVEYMNGSGISLYNTAYDTVTGCFAHDNFITGIKAFSYTIGATNHITISGNTVFHNDLCNAPGVPVIGSWTPAIQLLCATNSTVANNSVSCNFAEGIGLCRSDSCVVTSNSISDSYSVNLYLDNVTNSTLTKNVISCTPGATAYYRSGLPANGIQVGNESYGTLPTNISSGDIISSNIVYNTGQGFSYNNYQLGGGLRNFVVSNNTFYGTASCMFFIAQDSGTTNTLFANNIFRQTSSSLVYMPSGSGISFKNNCWYGAWVNPSVSGIGDVYSDPGFQSTSPGTQTQFSLASGSPCRNAGSTVGLPSAIAVGSDIGAIQSSYVSAQ